MKAEFWPGLKPMMQVLRRGWRDYNETLYIWYYFVSCGSDLNTMPRNGNHFTQNDGLLVISI